MPSASEQVSDLASEAKTRAEGAYRQVSKEAEVQAAHLADLIKQQPLISALVAIGVGFLIGRLSR